MSGKRTIPKFQSSSMRLDTACEAVVDRDNCKSGHNRNPRVLTVDESRSRNHVDTKPSLLALST